MLKMLTIVGILTFMSGKNSILGLSEPKKLNFLDILYLRAFKSSCSTELSMKKKLYNLGASAQDKQGFETICCDPTLEPSLRVLL